MTRAWIGDPYHQWKEHRGLLDILDGPQGPETDDLDQGEQMDPLDGDPSQVRQVRLMLLGHEDDAETFKELESIQGCNAHEQEDSKEDWHWDLTQQRCQKHGEADKDKDQNMGHSLFTEMYKKLMNQSRLISVELTEHPRISAFLPEQSLETLS